MNRGVGERGVAGCVVAVEGFDDGTRDREVDDDEGEGQQPVVCVELGWKTEWASAREAAGRVQQRAAERASASRAVTLRATAADVLGRDRPAAGSIALV